MMNYRLTSLIRKEFIQIIRDPRTLALVLVIPIMQLFLLGYAATNDVHNVSMAGFEGIGVTTGQMESASYDELIARDVSGSRIEIHPAHATSGR